MRLRANHLSDVVLCSAVQVVLCQHHQRTQRVDLSWQTPCFHLALRIVYSMQIDVFICAVAVITAGEPSEVHTVFQIAGPETPGILAEITQLLSHNGLEIRTAAVRST